MKAEGSKGYPKKVAILMAVLLVLIVLVLIIAKVDLPEISSTVDNCYETAAMAVIDAYDRAETVIIAGGEARAVDRLGSKVLAGALELPILLTTPEALPSQAAAVIGKLGVKKAYVLGGVEAVSDAVIGELMELGLFVKRISGDNCYEYATKIAAEVGKDQEFRKRFLKKIPNIITDQFRVFRK